MIDLYGWRPALQRAFDALCVSNNLADAAPARVIAQHRDLWRLAGPGGEFDARLSGRFKFEADEGGYPVAGDWLAVSREGENDGVIHAVLPRSSVFTRRAAGSDARQVVAANIDLALLVAALNGDLNPRRLERYLVAARDGGVIPLIVLTKADLCEHVDAAKDRIRTLAGGAPVLALSALQGEGLESLLGWLNPGDTCVLLGSSGAGKSTLINALMGRDVMATAAIRESDDRGRHTTTHREVFRLPNGALLMDTPGMRELGLVADESALDESFEDVAGLIARCRFSDCHHQGEPGCAVGAALASGDLEAGRWQAYQKLQRELNYAQRREDPEAEAENRARWKKIHGHQRAKAKHKDKNRDWS